MADAAEVVFTDDPMSAAGTRLAAELRSAMRKTELVRLAIPGGSALSALAIARTELGAEFERVQLTWVDERCVDVAHADSNRGAADRAGLLSGPHAPNRISPLYLDGEDPQAAVIRAATELRDVFDSALDVVLLGLGEDGHVASLFPGRFDRSDEALVLAIDDAPKPPPLRISLGWRMLATAPVSVVAVSGESKRHALDQTLAGDRRLPAVGLRGLVVLTDLDLESGKGKSQ